MRYLGLNFAIASKSPVSATTTVPDALSCSREVIAVFFGSGWDILAFNTDLQNLLVFEWLSTHNWKENKVIVRFSELYFRWFVDFFTAFVAPGERLGGPQGWFGLEKNPQMAIHSVPILYYIMRSSLSQPFVNSIRYDRWNFKQSNILEPEVSVKYMTWDEWVESHKFWEKKTKKKSDLVAARRAGEVLAIRRPV